MNIEKMREEFEKLFGMPMEESQLLAPVWQAAWQASRAAIEVELRPPHTDYDYSDSQVGGACKYYEQAKKAIESIGLKVKS